MPHDVFISYSTKDTATARAVCDALEAQGIKCWIAPRDITPSNAYGGAIIEAIRVSRVFVLVFSSNSNKSRDVVQEVDGAFRHEVPIIPFKVEDVKPSVDLEYYLSTPQWLDAIKPPLEFHLENLVDTVCALLKAPRKTERRYLHAATRRRRWAAAGAALALVAGLLLLFDPFGLFTGRVQPPPPPPENDERLFADAVGMLGDAGTQKQLAGLAALDKLAASGDERRYWQVMDHLTAYVREHAPWNGEGCAPRSPPERPPAINKVLAVIGARPPIYPQHFTPQDREKRKRDLRCTDLRRLRLLETAHLEYVDLQSSNLEGAVLRGAQLQNTILKDAVLRNTDLGAASLADVDFSGADLAGANLRETQGLSVFNLVLADDWQCAGLSDEVRRQIREELGAEVADEPCR